MVSKVETEQTAAGALRGVRVLDFGHYIPGPLLGMLLSDQGADVIKVERPEGDPARRHAAFSTWNRGKRSVVLDLKSEEGRRHAQALAGNADVLIENFRPGVADRLGIGYGTLSQANPALIYCSLPGFGEESPYRDQRGWESIVGAATGIHRAARGLDEPLFVPLPFTSTFAAIIGAVSVGMALCARQRTGEGQRIEVPLHSAMFTGIGRYMVKMHDMDVEYPFELPRRTMVKQYRCSDGRFIQLQGMYERFPRRFLTAAGHPEWVEEFVAGFGEQVDNQTVNMWRERFRNIFLQRTAEEWETALADAGGAGSLCRSVDEWLVHEQAIAAGMVAEVDDSRFGLMKQPGIPMKLRGTPGAIQGRAPRLGEHTEQVLGQLDAAASSASTPARAGGPQFAAPVEDVMGALQGVRVLDLCIVLAGPACGRTLGEFGADVIKINDASRPVDMEGSLDVNRCKRSILLNLKTEEGQEVFWRLVEKTDVIVENNRKGSLARLGLGYEDVKKRKPDIIYASLNTYGYDGPWSERPGWEQMAQAVTGIEVRRGGRDGMPLMFHYPVNDYGTGLLGAYAVALALLERNRTGEGQSVDCGLALTACLLQSPYFLDYAGFQRDEPEGLGVRGYSALSRLYPAADAWLYLHCPEEAGWRNLTALPEFAALAADPRYGAAASREESDGELVAELVRIFALKNRRQWVGQLNAAGISAIENVDMLELRDDPYVRRAGLVLTREHPGRGRADQVGTTARLSGTPVRLGRAAPILGAETNEILWQAGYTDGEIEALKSAGVVSGP
ncbi:MAG: CoA transferase [Dehalococcoidia bacterium]|nr:CoA transferase [Dehalococcoidia bacterium]